MAAVDPEKAVGVVIAVVVAALMIAYVLPIGIGAIADGTSTAEFNQSVDEEIQVNAEVNATLDSISTGTATVTLSEANGSETVTVSEGSNATAELPGGDVTVDGERVGTTSADLAYTSETTHGWGEGSSALYGLIPLLLILVPFVFLAIWATKSF